MQLQVGQDVAHKAETKAKKEEQEEEEKLAYRVNE